MTSRTKRGHFSFSGKVRGPVLFEKSMQSNGKQFKSTTTALVSLSVHLGMTIEKPDLQPDEFIPFYRLRTLSVHDILESDEFMTFYGVWTS